jgi:nitrite reductase (NO-forming)
MRLIVLASCRSPARSGRSDGPAHSVGRQQQTTSPEESPDSVPPADVSHGEAPIPAQLPPAKPTRLHRIRLETSHTPITVAPGVRYAAWTFGGTVPGPALRVRQGDTVDFTLVNRANMPHSAERILPDSQPGR